MGGTESRRWPREPARRASRSHSHRLHPAVVRAAAALGRYPGDVLRRILDVAGLAVHAVLRVHAKLGRTAGTGDNLVYAGGAIALRRLVVERQVAFDRHERIGELEMARLVFVVCRARL